ncbi:MAG: ferrous iron transport protein A [Candidatus Riflebacteria bacterium]|nr:ferrous iron transport protein A [Candidatus Riflebacteria bacterium]
MIINSICLADLPEGKSGTITSIDTKSATAQRLLDLGFVPGTPIKALKRAPMGDPTTFEIRGYQLGLRRSESEIIEVEIKPDEQ